MKIYLVDENKSYWPREDCIFKNPFTHVNIDNHFGCYFYTLDGGEINTNLSKPLPQFFMVKALNRVILTSYQPSRATIGIMFHVRKK